MGNREWGIYGWKRESGQINLRLQKTASNDSWTERPNNKLLLSLHLKQRLSNAPLSSSKQGYKRQNVYITFRLKAIFWFNFHSKKTFTCSTAIGKSKLHFSIYTQVNVGDRKQASVMFQRSSLMNEFVPHEQARPDALYILCWISVILNSNLINPFILTCRQVM